MAQLRRVLVVRSPVRSPLGRKVGADRHVRHAVLSDKKNINIDSVLMQKNRMKEE